MEYSFRRAAHEPEISVLLGHLELAVHTNQAVETIPYDGIYRVKLHRHGGYFSITVYSNGHKPLHITSRRWDANGNAIQNTSAYITFVRVLHFHLRDKASAGYHLAGDLGAQVIYSLIGAAVGLALSLTLDLTSLNLMPLGPQSIVLGATSLLAALTWQTWRSPDKYDPGQIPLHFLP